jgi:hypothetical protein
VNTRLTTEQVGLRKMGAAGLGAVRGHADDRAILPAGLRFIRERLALQNLRLLNHAREICDRRLRLSGPKIRHVSTAFANLNFCI